MVLPVSGGATVDAFVNVTSSFPVVEVLNSAALPSVASLSFNL